MTPNRDSILVWLNEIGKDASWLAYQCGVSESEIGQWISGATEIPIFALLTISIMMAGTIYPSSSSRNDGEFNCSLPLSEKQIEILKANAVKTGMTLEDYIAQSSLVMSDNFTGNDQQRPVPVPDIRLKPGYLTEFDCTSYQMQIDRVSAEKAILEQFLEDNGIKLDFDTLLRKYKPWSNQYGVGTDRSGSPGSNNSGQHGTDQLKG